MEMTWVQIRARSRGMKQGPVVMGEVVAPGDDWAPRVPLALELVAGGRLGASAAPREEVQHSCCPDPKILFHIPRSECGAPAILRHLTED